MISFQNQHQIGLIKDLYQNNVISICENSFEFEEEFNFLLCKMCLLVPHIEC